MSAPGILPRVSTNRAGLVLLGGIVAATLDLMYICALVYALHGLGPGWIMRSVAAGWLGRDAMGGGPATALLGLVSHYFIAVAMAFAWFLAAARIPALARKPVRCGLLYGVALYLVMNFVVVPLSAAGTGLPRTWGWVDLLHVAAHMFLVGVPIGWFVARAVRASR